MPLPLALTIHPPILKVKGTLPLSDFRHWASSVDSESHTRGLVLWFGHLLLAKISVWVLPLSSPPGSGQIAFASLEPGLQGTTPLKFPPVLLVGVGEQAFSQLHKPKGLLF